MKCFLFMGLSILAMHFPISYGGRGYTVSKKERTADKVLLKASKTIERQTGLTCIGTGGRMMYDVEMLALSFQQEGELDVAGAREKVIKAGEIFLEEINSCEELKKYLKPCPFTAENIAIRLFIVDTDRNYLPVEKLQYVSALDGTIRYVADYPGRIKSYQLAEETFEEARKKVQSQPEVIVESKQLELSPLRKP